MWRLILIYPYSEDRDCGLKEYNELRFDRLQELLVYLEGVNPTNVYRVIIERVS
jgi:hypothetical protein